MNCMSMIRTIRFRMFLIIVLGLAVSAAGEILDFSPASKSALAADKYFIYSFSVHGATCVTCFIEIEKVLRSTKGIKAVRLDQRQRPLKIALVFDQAQIQAETISKILEARKYQVTEKQTVPYNKETFGKFLRKPENALVEKDEPNLMRP
jgi:copper chaperone CopZ